MESSAWLGLFLMSALLALVLVACGGEEPFTVAPAPAPPPVPPRFQTEAIQVDLGATGKALPS